MACISKPSKLDSICEGVKPTSFEQAQIPAQKANQFDDFKSCIRLIWTAVMRPVGFDGLPICKWA